MLRPKEVCQRLGISYATLRGYVKKGYIKPVTEREMEVQRRGRRKIDGNC